MADLGNGIRLAYLVFLGIVAAFGLNADDKLIAQMISCTYPGHDLQDGGQSINDSYA